MPTQNDYQHLKAELARKEAMLEDIEYKRHSRESTNFVMLLCATTGFLLVHFHLVEYINDEPGTSEVVFGLSVFFNLAAAFGWLTRS